MLSLLPSTFVPFWLARKGIIFLGLSLSHMAGEGTGIFTSTPADRDLDKRSFEEEFFGRSSVPEKP